MEADRYFICLKALLEKFSSIFLIIYEVWLDGQKRKFDMRHYMLEVVATITNITPYPYSVGSINLLVTLENAWAVYLYHVIQQFYFTYAANRNSSLKFIHKGM